MSLDDLKQFIEHLASVVLPKLFTVTAGGNLLVVGLAMADVVNIFVSMVSFIFMAMVFVATIRHKRRQAYLTELEIAKAETAIGFNNGNMHPIPSDDDSVTSRNVDSL